jgi:hypothetical protein
MEQFQTLSEAQDFVSAIVDVPVPSSTETVRPGVVLNKAAVDMGDGRFTNSYDLAFRSDEPRAEIVAFDALLSTYDFMREARQYSAAVSGGFFYLADRASGSPRQLSLNLSISRGDLRSLPVVDRESVVVERNNIEVRTLVALGSLTLNGHDLDWSGSLTDYDTKVKVFSNGNVILRHELDAITGSARVLDERSRYTPEITDDEMVDVGFIGRGKNDFIGVGGSTTGSVDIFAHDFVIRCPRQYVEGNSELQINTIGGIALSRFEGGAFSAGPMMNIADFTSHPINSDASLGSRSPFMENQLARTVLYKTDDDWTHIRLFDGRPGSRVFPGVTPSEAISHIMDEQTVTEGCFLDPGQTAKLCINDGQQIESYGNRHYMHWPTQNSPQFLWTPDAGRPVANVLAL